LAALYQKSQQFKDPDSRRSAQKEPQMQRTITSAAYDARILKLRLPEQDLLKDNAERCSADPASLAGIGRAVGQQVRIKRRDDSHFDAVYTVNQPNPDVPTRADVVRTGLTGRERLGDGGELEEVTVEATVLDAPGESTGVRFFEVAEDAGHRSFFIVIAPHGGMIEKPTDEQAAEVILQLRTAGFPASMWVCKGFGDATKGASARFHITSDDIHPASFPLLGSLMSRRFFYGVSFHGFAQKGDEADIYIGGAAPPRLKAAVQRALNRAGLSSLKVKISTSEDSSKFQGGSKENVINRLAPRRGIQLEQSEKARAFHKEIAGAVADVFASPWRWLLWTLMRAFR
jgi:phage replication-related protein YjqB (UPF0714/DUF867 family)